MYRHEAISIARQVMDRARITTELQPWVVDAILSAVNGTLTPEPDCAFDASECRELLQHRESLELLESYHETNAGEADAIDYISCVQHHTKRARMFREMIDALPTDEPDVVSTHDIVAGDRLPTPENWSVVTGERVPVAWRRPNGEKYSEPRWDFMTAEQVRTPADVEGWQPLYAD